jgi:hypothetical protein
MRYWTRSLRAIGIGRPLISANLRTNCDTARVTFQPFPTRAYPLDWSGGAVPSRALLMAGLRMFPRALQWQIPRFKLTGRFLDRDPSAASGFPLLAVLYSEIDFAPLGTPVGFQSWYSHKNSLSLRLRRSPERLA